MMNRLFFPSDTYLLDNLDSMKAHSCLDRPGTGMTSSARLSLPTN